GGIPVPELAIFFNGPPPRPQRPERRRAGRLPPGLQTVCRVFVALGGVVRRATVRDLSTAGLCVTLHRPLTAGTPLAVELTNPLRRFSRRQPARVVRARRGLAG